MLCKLKQGPTRQRPMAHPVVFKYLKQTRAKLRAALQTALPLIHSLIHSFISNPFPPTDLQRRNAQTVGDSSSSYKIDYVIVIKNILNL